MTTILLYGLRNLRLTKVNQLSFKTINIFMVVAFLLILRVPAANGRITAIGPDNMCGLDEEQKGFFFADDGYHECSTENCNRTTMLYINMYTCECCFKRMIVLSTTVRQALCSFCTFFRVET